QQTCGVCSGNVTAQALFTTACSHSFHRACIGNKQACPVCHSLLSPLYNPINYQPIPPIPPFYSPTSHPVVESEPLQFSDDESLPPMTSSPASPDPLPKVSVKAVPERPAIASSESEPQFTVLVGIKAPTFSDDARSSQRAPIDLVAVLDVSGSMGSSSKLTLLKQAMRFVIDNLGPNDRLSIVSFESRAYRILGLRRMTEKGRVDAKKAVDSLEVMGLHKNPVASIIFLSDGNDTCHTIFPENKGQQGTIPVHSFGFGSDHDPVTMHAISDASGGTFSFVESYSMVQDAFASCIGGLLSVVTQDLCLMVRSASHGVEIKSLYTGRYASGTSNQGSQGQINIGDLYADEEKEFLINVSVPSLLIQDDNDEKKTSLLDIMCSYKDVVSKGVVEIESELVEIKRPKTVSPGDMVVSMEVDRQRNRVFAAECIAKAQQMAESGDLAGAGAVLAEQREKGGRAFALSGMSSHDMQRATTRGGAVAGAAVPRYTPCSPRYSPTSPAYSPTSPAYGGAYVTPNMVNMVTKSQQVNNNNNSNNNIDDAKKD
ncbi:uncharacterized protein sll0103, partial [Phtheirospermum japonicum]